MSIRIDIKRTDFYNELSEVQQRQYFDAKDKNFLPSVDNIYYSLMLSEDCKDNTLLKPLMRQLDFLKSEAMEYHQPQDYSEGLQLDLKSFKMYKYCLTCPDLYDIFILGQFMSDVTPRIVVQIRAYGLWIYGVDKMLADSYNHVLSIFNPYGCTIESCRENRIDYCYHTNAVMNPEKIFSDRSINKHMYTTKERWTQVGRIEHEEGQIFLRKDYFALGNRNTNDVFIRFYNKALEVIEQGYKGFFFEIWLQNGLISFYDRYCFEKAFLERNFDYVHKAKLQFYVEYGTDKRVKREFELALVDKNTTLREFKRLAILYMPEVTTVMNIEFETKRRFYYFSDAFIDGVLATAPSRDSVPEVLKRLYKILDNRAVFLKYLTKNTVSFNSAWWERLRSTKLSGLDINEELVRDYTNKLDYELVKKRFINTVATNAVYNENLESDFLTDISDALSNLNDNHVQEFRVSLSNGTDVDGLASPLLATYRNRKYSKYQKIKNRIKKDKQEA